MAQNILLLLLGVPTKIAVTQPHTSLGVTDYVLGVLGFLTVLTEFIADNQQHSYQTFKRSGKLNPNEWFGARFAWTERDVKRGFVTKGLWAWSRHPNFSCEQSFWVRRILRIDDVRVDDVGVWLGHCQLDSARMCGWTVGERIANVAWVAGTIAAKSSAVHAVSPVNKVNGVSFTVQVPRRVQGVPRACWDVRSILHLGEGCGAKCAGKEGGGRRDCVRTGDEKGRMSHCVVPGSGVIGLYFGRICKVEKDAIID